MLSARYYRRHRAGVDLRARVDDHVLVLTREQPEDFLERGGVGRAGTVEQLGSREDLEPGLVLDHQLAQELGVEAVQVVDRVEQRVAAPNPEKERHLSQSRLQVDDDRRAPREARHFHRAVDRERRGARATLRRRRTRASWTTAAPPSIAAATRCGGRLPGIRWPAAAR